MPKKSRQKFKYFENEKSFWDEIKFFIIFEGLSFKQIKKVFLEGESPTLAYKHQHTLSLSPEKNY